jgi:hypothetical protein
MADLILTDEEKKAVSWLDLSDDALGKVCRKACLVIMEGGKPKDDPDDRRPMIASSAGMLLCGIMDDSNATKTVLSFEGLTCGEKQRGNWRVTIEKINPDEATDESQVD